MSQGLFTAASGIRVNQTGLNIVANNIANVNSVGFKASSARFANVFASTISGGTPPSGTLGGTNPQQIGNGTLISDIPTDFSQGGTQYTGRATDMMINGNGFFVVERLDANIGSNNSGFYLTRAGNFSLDSNGNLITANGNRVKGSSQSTGSGPTTQTNVRIPQEFIVTKDLDANNNIIGTHLAGLGVTNAAVAAAAVAGTASQITTTVKLVNFTMGSNGGITATYSNGDRISVRLDQNTVDPVDATVARNEILHLPAEGGQFSPGLNTAAGVPSDAADDGVVDQIAGFPVFNAPAGGNALEGMEMNVQSAAVTNPAGLIYDGNNNFLIGANSGEVYFGHPGAENRGALNSGALESSNVDIAREFTNMIVLQRGLEASSRVIRTHSEVMQTVINAV